MHTAAWKLQDLPGILGFLNGQDETILRLNAMRRGSNYVGGMWREWHFYPPCKLTCQPASFIDAGRRPKAWETKDFITAAGYALHGPSPTSLGGHEGTGPGGYCRVELNYKSGTELRKCPFLQDSCQGHFCISALEERLCSLSWTANRSVVFSTGGYPSAFQKCSLYKYPFRRMNTRAPALLRRHANTWVTRDESSTNKP